MYLVRRKLYGCGSSTMEPMAVSPGKSPTQSGQYLPSFLLGELASPCSGGQSSSPYTPSTNYTSRGSRTKLEGPPIVGLFDEVTSSSSVQTPNNNPSLHTSVHNASTSFLDSSCIENQENANFWVVVYGFPPAQVSQILSLFSQMGRVAESNYPVNANWVCICYTNRADMRKALSMNGKVLSGNVMIGVTERKIQFVHCTGYYSDEKYCKYHDLAASPSVSLAKVQRTAYPPTLQHMMCCCRDNCDNDRRIYRLDSFSDNFKFDRADGTLYKKIVTWKPLNNSSNCRTVGSENCSIGVGSQVNSSLANGSISSPTSPKIRPLAISKRHNTQNSVNAGQLPTPDTSIVGKFMDFIFSW